MWMSLNRLNPHTDKQQFQWYSRKLIKKEPHVLKKGSGAFLFRVVLKTVSSFLHSGGNVIWIWLRLFVTNGN